MATSTAGTTVAVAVSQPLFRAGLRALLAGGGACTVVGEAGNGAGALRLACEARPQVLLLDLALSAPDALSVLRQLPTLAPEVAALVMTANAGKPKTLAAIRLGARGIVSKEATPELLFRAVQSVATGQPWFDRAGVAPLPRTPRRGPAQANPTGPAPLSTSLTRREMQIVREVSGGASNRVVARECAISEQTVKNHLSSIYVKVGVSSRLELALHFHKSLGPA
jgi:DNA-binding NarL/FixJ family response regulator